MWEPRAEQIGKSLCYRSGGLLSPDVRATESCKDSVGRSGGLLSPDVRSVEDCKDSIGRSVARDHPCLHLGPWLSRSRPGFATELNQSRTLD